MIFKERKLSKLEIYLLQNLMSRKLFITQIFESLILHFLFTSWLFYSAKRRLFINHTIHNFFHSHFSHFQFSFLFFFLTENRRENTKWLNRNEIYSIKEGPLRKLSYFKNMLFTVWKNYSLSHHQERKFCFVRGL